MFTNHARFHPQEYGDEVTSAPAESTVQESGDSNVAEPIGYDGGRNNGTTATHGNLPHPGARAFDEGTGPLEFDMLDLLKRMDELTHHLRKLTDKVSLNEDEAIKRRMRGPLRETSTFQADGTATIAFGPVPSGEIWLVDRYIVVSDNGAPTAALDCFVYDGAIGEPTSEIDFTALGNNNVSDNAQPLFLFPNSYITFFWTGGTPNNNVWARVNYRSIGVNLQFLRENK